MSHSQHHAVILGAGKPARGQMPSALWSVPGHGRVLNWLVSAVGQSCADVTFVGGYCFSEIVVHPPAMLAIINPNLAIAGTVGSLLRAGLQQPDRVCMETVTNAWFEVDSVQDLDRYQKALAHGKRASIYDCGA